MHEDSLGAAEERLDAMGGGDVDELFGLLASRESRHVLFYLTAASETTLDRLADVVAGLEATATGVGVSPAERDRIRARLYHNVLPRLDDGGYVEFDADAHTVRRREVPPLVDALVDLVTA